MRHECATNGAAPALSSPLMTIEQDRDELVQQIADDVDAHRIEREAHQLATTPEDLLLRVVTEIRARLGDLPPSA